MKALHAEMKLRDETRELEQVRSDLETKDYQSKAEALALTQGEIEGNVRLAVSDIRALENAQQFGKEIQLLSYVAQVMNEAEVYLARPDTGRDPIGAETEAIEMLLQAKRPKPNSGGGGGGGSPGGGGGGAASRAASLAGLGPGKEQEASYEKREVQQSTGKAGRELPVEFRDGLDRYFESLERKGG